MEAAREHGQDSRRRKAWAAVVPVLALLAVAAGIVAALLPPSPPSFGWFAYAPLSNETFTGGGLVYMDAGTKVGVALTAAGLLVLAFWSGYRTARTSPGRRRAAHAGGPPPES